MHSKSEIDTLIQARYPGLYIVSAEESRILSEVTDIAKTRGMNLVTWSASKGFRCLGTEQQRVTSSLKGQDAPPAALKKIEGVIEDAIVVLLDFHPFLNDPVILRHTRDVIEAFRTGKNRRTLIFLSPVSKIPVEIEKSIALIDWTLPTREDLAKMVKTLAEASNLRMQPADASRAVDAALGLTEVEAENAFAKAVVRSGSLDPSTIQEEKKQIIRKSGLLEFVETEESANTVGGLGNAKAWLRTRAKAFSEEARAFGLPPPKGLIAVGIPGTGKSLLAKACGKIFEAPLLKLDMGKIFQGLVGSSEENMRKVLSTVEAVSPCVLWIDEIEKSLSGAGGESDGGTTSRVFGTFLTWMEEKKASVFVVATANGIDKLPPELSRKGRFDEIFFVDLPTPSERADIFRIHLGKLKRSPDLVTEALIDATNGHTGAEIRQAVEASLYTAFDLGEDVTASMLLGSARRIVPLSQTSGGAVTRLREWAEGKTVPASLGEAQAPASGRRLN